MELKNYRINLMIILLPFLVSIVLYLLVEEDNIILYSIFSLIIISLNNLILTSEIIIIIILSLVILLYTIYQNQNKILGMIFLLGSILGILSTSLISFFISIEMLSFTMIILINLYIQDQYPGIIYYLLSGILSALLILSLGYIYIDPINLYGYKIFYVVIIGKLGLIPFHILLIRIYNNISLNIILLLDIPYKFILFIFLYRIYNININLNLFILLSIIIGSLGSLYYNNLLNILVYSSLFHYGLIMTLLSYQHWDYFLYYLIIYMIMVIIYLFLITSKYINYTILSSDSYTFIWFLLIINLIGVPPLQGFFIKLYPLYLLIYNYSFITFIIIVLGVLLLSYTYLRILLSLIIKDSKKMDHEVINHFFNIKNQNPFFSHFISSLIIFISIPLFI